MMPRKITTQDIAKDNIIANGVRYLIDKEKNEVTLKNGDRIYRSGRGDFMYETKGE